MFYRFVFVKELEKNNFDEDSIINEEEFRTMFENVSTLDSYWSFQLIGE